MMMEILIRRLRVPPFCLWLVVYLCFVLAYVIILPRLNSDTSYKIALFSELYAKQESHMFRYARSGPMSLVTCSPQGSYR